MARIAAKKNPPPIENTKTDADDTKQINDIDDDDDGTVSVYKIINPIETETINNNSSNVNTLTQVTRIFMPGVPESMNNISATNNDDDDNLLEVKEEFPSSPEPEEIHSIHSTSDTDSENEIFPLYDIVDLDENNDDNNDNTAVVANDDNNDWESIKTASDRDSPLSDISEDGKYFVCQFCQNNVRNLKHHLMWIHAVQYHTIRKAFFTKHWSKNDAADLKEKFRQIFTDSDKYADEFKCVKTDDNVVNIEKSCDDELE